MHKLFICVLDETEYWSKDIQDKAGKIFGVYFYNPGIVTHCCEITPSYELWYLSSFARDLPEDEEERENFINMIENEGSERERALYCHCNVIDKLPEIKRGEIKQGKYHWDSFDEEDTEIDEIEEEYRCNPHY